MVVRWVICCIEPCRLISTIEMVEAPRHIPSEISLLSVTEFSFLLNKNWYKTSRLIGKVGFCYGKPKQIGWLQ